MKYKCIAKCFVDGSVIMRPDDIVVIEGNKFYNITTGVDYKDVPDKEHLKTCLVSLSDETTAVPNVKKPIIPILSEVDKFKAITEKMADLFRRKNHDYGNSFELSLNEEGLAASRIRMGDKWNRFKKLSRSASRIDAEVDDESLRDTLIDMANYAIMTVMWLDEQQCDSARR